MGASWKYRRSYWEQNPPRNRVSYSLHGRSVTKEEFEASFLPAESENDEDAEEPKEEPRAA